MKHTQRCYFCFICYWAVDFKPVSVTFLQYIMCVKDSVTDVMNMNNGYYTDYVIIFPKIGGETKLIE